MSRVDFMKELESLLSDIPLEEKNAALQYYNDYFEDAGAEHEDEVIKELGTPARVAETIKADLNANGAQDRGYFTEKGYEDTAYTDNKFEIVDPLKQNKKESKDSRDINSCQQNTENNGQEYGNARNYNNGQYSGNGQNYNNGQYNGNGQNYNNGQFNGNGQNYSNGQNFNNGSAYSSGQNNNSQKQDKKDTNLPLIILIAIFAFTIGLPITLTVFSLIVAAFATVFGLLIGFGIAGMAMIAAGIVLFVMGIIKIAIPFEVLALCGSGLLIFGLGILFVLFSSWLCRKVLPALIKGVVELCRLPFRNRSVTA